MFRFGKAIVDPIFLVVLPRIHQFETFELFARAHLDGAGERFIETLPGLDRMQQAVAFHDHADLAGQFVQRILLRCFIRLGQRLARSAHADVIVIGDRA